MSDYHRQTMRISRHAREDARHTVRAPREQTGGAKSRGSGETSIGVYSIPAERVTEWNIALRAYPDLTPLAGVITNEKWGEASTAINTYIKILECQDELFNAALSIIYNKCGIDINADNFDEEVITKLSTRSQQEQKTLKEYFADVYHLITCEDIDGSKFLRSSITAGTSLIIKLERIMLEPLSNTLLWPKRVTNTFVNCVAGIMLELKEDPTKLTKASTEELQVLFSDVYNAYIQRVALFDTSKEIRDGFYVWQKLTAGVILQDECAQPDMSKCFDKDGGRNFWKNFCKYYAQKGASMFDSPEKPLSQHLFSRLLADIFKLYEKQTAAGVRDTVIGKFLTVIENPVDKSSLYRPNIVKMAKTPEGAMMRRLDPEQYAFIFHLLHTLEKLETPAAPTAVSSSSSAAAARPVAAPAAEEAATVASAAPAAEAAGASSRRGRGARRRGS